MKIIVRHFHLKIGGRKAELIARIEDLLHFDGYEFHLKPDGHEMHIEPELLEKSKKYTINTSKKVKIKKKDYIHEFQPSKLFLKNNANIFNI